MLLNNQIFDIKSTWYYNKVRIERAPSWLKERALSELKLPRHLPNYTLSDLFREFSLLSFFSVIESEISEQASLQVTKEGPYKGL